MKAQRSIFLINTVETAELLGLRPTTLELWRVAGRGPSYRKVGRAVRYVEAEVLQWLASQTRSSTSQTASVDRPSLHTGGRP